MRKRPAAGQQEASAGRTRSYRPPARREAGTPRLRFVEFELPTLVDKPPEGAGWLHEIKYDGYRTELILERGKVRVHLVAVVPAECDVERDRLGRVGHDWIPPGTGRVLDHGILAGSQNRHQDTE